MPRLATKIIIFLILIFFFGGFLRFYKLSEFPVQLSHDEVTQLYDGISIAQTQKDIYGNFLPTMFISVNDFKSPFYTYLTSITYLLLGDSEVIVRIPGAIFGILLILAVFVFARKLLKNSYIALLVAGISAISPFEIFFSRKSFENVPGIFFMLIGFTFLLNFLEKKNSFKWIYLGILFLSFAMYTYFSHAIIIPLLFLSFALIYHKDLLATGGNFLCPSVKNFLFPLLFGLFLIIPLLLIIINNPGSRYRSQTVFITQDINFGKLAEFGNSENQFISKFNHSKSFLDFSLNRYLKQFNPQYLFGNGLDLTNQGPLGMGILFSLQLPLLLLGVVYLIKSKELKKETKFLTALILIGMVPSGLTFEEYSPHRSIMVFTLLNIVSAVGLSSFIQIIRERFSFKTQVGILSLLSLIFIFQLTYFIHIYFINYPFDKSQHIHYPFKEVSKFAWSKHSEFDQIVFDPLFGQAAPVIGTGAHYYLGYYGNYPPAKMQQGYKVGSKPREVMFDKFSIRKIEWNEDIHLKNTLLILSPWSFDPKILPEINSKIIKTFYFYDHQPAFYAVKTD